MFGPCANNQQLKWLTVIDEWTRESLAIDVHCWSAAADNHSLSAEQRADLGWNRYAKDYELCTAVGPATASGYGAMEHIAT